MDAGKVLASRLFHIQAVHARYSERTVPVEAVSITSLIQCKPRREAMLRESRFGRMWVPLQGQKVQTLQWFPAPSTIKDFPMLALIAHDQKKEAMVGFVRRNLPLFQRY